jgi:fused-like protein
MLIKPLGKGANGEVFLVKDLTTFEEYAMKTIEYYVGERNVYNEIFTKNLSHENIVSVVDYHQQPPKIIGGEPRFIFFYKYLPRTVDLYTILSGSKIPFEKKKYISKKLLDALIYLHSQRVVHSDIKPSNILIDVETYEPYLIDFDLSCEYFHPFTPENRDKKNRTCLGRDIKGTPYYVSPYVLTSEHNTYATDVYSLGYTLLCMFLDIKEPPFGLDMLPNSFNMKDDLYKIKKKGGLKIEDSKIYRKMDGVVTFNNILLPENIVEALNLMIQNDRNEELDLEKLKEMFY